VEQDIENWKKQQMLMGNKSGTIPGGNISLNQLLHSGVNGNQNYSAAGYG